MSLPQERSSRPFQKGADSRRFPVLDGHSKELFAIRAKVNVLQFGSASYSAKALDRADGAVHENQVSDPLILDPRVKGLDSRYPALLRFDMYMTSLPPMASLVSKDWKM